MTPEKITRDVLKCPYCRYQYLDIKSLLGRSENNGTINCWCCKKEFDWKVKIRRTWTAKRKGNE